ncbi:peptidyl-prolyl cis-trans isomerase, partial [candidate division KSB1 bacterium]|nr:peptidyl-prolyl cis-trans isomerase [candidate division KSB1 bacterium]
TRDSLFVAQLEQNKRRWLIQNQGPLFQAIVPKTFPVDSMEIYYFYHKQAQVLEIAHILSPNRARADSLYHLLKNGADFGTLAQKFSIDPMTRERRGRFPRGYIFGMLGQPFDDVCLALKDGELSRPIKTKMGYHLILVINRIKHAQKPLAQEKKNIEFKIKQQKFHQFMAHYTQQLMTQYQVQIDSTVATLVVQLYRIDPKTNLASLDLSRISPAERETVVARFNEGKLTVASVAMEYNQTPAMNRLPLQASADVFDFIDQVLQNYLFSAEAERLKLLDSGTVQQEYSTLRQQMLVRFTKYKLVHSKIQVADYETREYYREHQAEYQTRPYPEVARSIENMLRAKKYYQEYNVQLHHLRKKHPVIIDEKLLVNTQQELQAIRQQMPAPPQTMRPRQLK